MEFNPIYDITYLKPIEQNSMGKEDFVQLLRENVIKYGKINKEKRKQNSDFFDMIKLYTDQYLIDSKSVIRKGHKIILEYDLNNPVLQNVKNIWDSTELNTEINRVLSRREIFLQEIVKIIHNLDC